MGEATPIIILWWNTSLSPLAKSRAQDSDKEFAIAYLAELRRVLHPDIVGLAEVCAQDLRDILTTLDDPNLSVHDATANDDGHGFDTAVLFDRRRLELTTNRALLDSYGRANLKIGEQLLFQVSDAVDPLHLFVSHWPSRLHCAPSDPRRTEIGTSLRRTLDDLRATSSAKRQYIVLMGDYNDDPFSPSLAEHLLATRDRELAKNNDSYLYNPFWRRLGESAPFVYGRDVSSICGTHFYRGNNQGRWFTFDQIIFSSAFLSGGPLYLNEDKSIILRTTELESRLQRAGDIFDHLPVVGTIDVRSNQ